MKLIMICLMVLCGMAKGLTQNAIHIDSIDLQVDMTVNNEAIYIHKMRHGETLFSIAQLFKIPYADLLQINDLENAREIKIGSDLKIPIDVTLVQTNPIRPQGVIPVIYKVKPRETLFKISHSYFPQAIQDLINRNNITSFSLDKGQKLIVGWWPVPRSPLPVKQDTLPIFEPIVFDTLERDEYLDAASHLSLQLDTIMVKEPDTLVRHRTKGIAFWDKSGHDLENLFVMHSQARENSYIKLKNPLTGLQVIAKVIMEIPAGVYTNDIDIVITPAVARQLGALDSRFRIEMDYYE